MTIHARTIIEETSVSKFLKKEKAKYPRIEQVFEGIKWVLARAPERGYDIGGAWILKSYPWHAEGAPSLRVLYTYDEDSVNIVAIDISDAEI